MCQDLDEDFEVLLLRDIRDLFDLKHEDRLPSAVIIENLNLLCGATGAGSMTPTRRGP
jgi:hypothetical protein